MSKMPEKTNKNSRIFNPMVQWSFKVLALSVFLGLIIIWGIDGWKFSNSHRDLVTLKLKNQNKTNVNLIPNIISIHLNLSSYEPNLTKTHQNLEKTQQKYPIVGPIPVNLTQIQSNLSKLASALPNFPNNVDLEWVSAELDLNYTSNLLSGWLAPGGEPCRERKTVKILIPDLDGIDKIELPTGEIHEFVFQALDEAGDYVCLGGDYFELDLSGEKWKSRPPIRDFGNGSYSFSVQVHPEFEGEYTLTVILLFRHYEGLKFSPRRFVFDRELRKIPIKFSKSSGQLRELKVCKKSDFERNAWSGRWTRHGKSEDCKIDNDGRYRCLEPSFPCKIPWCFGNLGVLESNGWTYSAHCSFRLFSSEEAWNCLNNRWIFFWGDSNHCDTIRNILHFILDVQEISVVPRRFDMNITNPRNKEQMVRITSIFNGHENETMNYHGLYSLEDQGYRALLKGYFSGDLVPDTIVMNSGLHDGVFWRNIRRFAKGAEQAARFWGEMAAEVRERGVKAPEVIFRSTVATGGYARSLAFDTEKMEAYNGVFLDKLRRHGVVDLAVDYFDMTYAWHYDNRCNDGVHYGRAPAKARWRDGQIGHQYFVDLMLGHVLLNALCTR